jgi:NTE family protein
MSRKKLGLALGGGAARGIAHIGVLKALDLAGIKPDLIAGTSIGAIVGGLYASGCSAVELEKMSKNIGGKSFWTLFRPSIHHDGFIDSKNIEQFLQTLVKDRDISSLPIPFRAVATDFFTGRRQGFTKSSMFTAMRASSSIPVLFTPTHVEGRTYIDGGFTDPVPVTSVREMGADIIIAVNVVPELSESFKNMKENRAVRSHQVLGKKQAFKPLFPGFNGFSILKPGKGVPGILDISLHTRDIVEYNLMKLDIEISKPDFLIEPNIGGYVGWFDFGRINELIVNGQMAVEKVISQLKEKLA